MADKYSEFDALLTVEPAPPDPYAEFDAMLAVAPVAPQQQWGPSDPYRIDFNEISGAPATVPTAGDKARQATLMGGMGFAEGVAGALTGVQELPQTIIQGMTAGSPNAVQRLVGRKANEILDAFWATKPGLSPSEAAAGINSLKDELVKQNGDPALADSFLWSKLPRGAGNLLWYLTGGAVGTVATGGASAAATVATAIPSQVGAMIQEAIDAGKTKEEARAYAAVGIPLGASELVGIPGKFFRILGKAPSSLAKAFRVVVEGGVENAIQEVGQTVTENVAARVYIERNRDIFEGVGDAAGMGGTLGILASAAAAALGMRHRRIIQKAAETGQVSRDAFREAMGIPSSEAVPANDERVEILREKLRQEEAAPPVEAQQPPPSETQQPSPSTGETLQPGETIEALGRGYGAGTDVYDRVNAAERARAAGQAPAAAQEPRSEPGGAVPPPAAEVAPEAAETAVPPTPEVEQAKQEFPDAPELIVPKPPPPKTPEPGTAEYDPAGRTAAMHAATEAARERLQMPPRSKFKITMQQGVDEAVRRYAEDPDIQDKLIAELKTTPRPLRDWEFYLLVQRKVVLDSQYNTTLEGLEKAEEAGDTTTVAMLEARETAQLEQLEQLFEAAEQSGTLQSADFRARQAFLDAEFDLARIMRQARKKKGSPLTPEDRQEVANLQRELKTRNDEIERLRAAGSEEAIKKRIDEAIKQWSAEHKPKVGTKRRTAAQKGIDAAWKDFEAKTKGKLFSTPLDPEIVGSAVNLAKAYAKLGIATVQDFMDAVGQRLGKDKVEAQRPLFEQAWQQAQTERKPQVGALADKAAASSVANKLARFYVESGVTDREAVVDAVHADLMAAMPEWTRRDTMDAISGYGQSSPLKKDTVSVILRDIRGQLQQIAKLKDIEAGVPLLKTGPERRTPSAEERGLIKQVEEAKRRKGVAAGSQLKSALDGIKTRLRNEIEDMDRQIAAKEKTVKNRTRVKYDAEADALRAKRDAKREIYDAMFGIESEKRRWADEREAASLRERIGAAKKHLQDGTLPAGRPQRTIGPPENQALRSELADLNKAIQQSDPAVRKRLEPRVDALKKKLADEDFSTRARPAKPEPSAAVKPILEEIAALQQAIRDGRNLQSAYDRADALLTHLHNETLPAKKAGRVVSPELKAARDLVAGIRDQLAQSDPAQRERMQSQLEKLRERVAKQDFAPKPKKERRAPTFPEAAAMLDEIEALRATIRGEQQKAIIAKRLTDLAEEYDRRAKANDFKPRERKPPKTSPEIAAARVKLDDSKKNLADKMRQFEKENRSLIHKIVDGASEVNAVTRFTKAGLEFSVVFRQCLIESVRKPGRTLSKDIPRMLHAWSSKAAAADAMEQLENFPNWKSGLYAQMKLPWLDPNGTLSKRQEDYRSELFAGIPVLNRFGPAVSVFMNYSMAYAADNMAARSADTDGTLSKEGAIEIGKVAGIFSGQGDFGKYPQARTALNNILFSSSYRLSRIQTMTLRPLRGRYRRDAKLTPEEGKRIQRAAARVYARTAFNLALMTAGMAVWLNSDDDEETEVVLWPPTHSGFLKWKFGNQRLDPWAGFQQLVVLGARAASGTVSRLSGESVSTRGAGRPYGGDKSSDIVWKYAKSGFAPWLSGTFNILDGESYDKRGDEWTLAGELIDLVKPIYWQSVVEALRDDGVDSEWIDYIGTAIRSGLSAFGPGLDTYEDKPKPVKYRR